MNRTAMNLIATALTWTPAERHQLEQEAYDLGTFGATYRPKAIGRSLPASATLRDCRDAVARDFIESTDSAVHCLLPLLLAGFDDEADHPYPQAELRKPRASLPAGAAVWCVDDEAACGFLTLGRKYRVQEVREGGWVFVADDTGDGPAWHHSCHFIVA